MKSRIPMWRLWVKDADECKEWFESYLNKRVLKKKALPHSAHIKKAEHNMAFSNWLIDMHTTEIPKVFGEDENFYDWAITSYYYSIYHQALALISQYDLASKSHSATLCAVIYHYFHTNNNLTLKDIELLGTYLSEDDIDAFSRTKTLREQVCYGVSREFEKDILLEAKNNASKFLEKVRIILSGHKA